MSKKTLLSKLFGCGKIPYALMDQLESESILFVDEGIYGATTYKKYRTPGRFSYWRKNWYTATIALTEERIIGLCFGKYILNVPLSDHRLKDMTFSSNHKGLFLVSFDAGLFNELCSGQIVFSFRTEYAQQLVEEIDKAVSRLS